MFAPARRLLILILILFLMGCAGAPPAGGTPTLEIPLSPTETPVSTPEIPQSTPGGVTTLRVWLPPQFDPANQTPAGDLFQARLNEFAIRRPNINIEIRLKNVEGPGGILDTLTTASSAAPLALPDLVALPRQGLEIAAGNGLLHPFDGLTTALDDPDWYTFSRELAHWQNATFGIPFGGDALLMVYRPIIISVPPADWASSLIITQTLTFPAADPKAWLTLLHYQSLNDAPLDENEHPSLDEFLLTNVFSYYQQASASELMPFWLTQYETDEQAWAAYAQNQADLAITWSWRYLNLAADDSAAAPIPTFDGNPFSLADGWVWALTANDPDRQLLAVQLAEYLTTSEYLASWTEAAGLIPPRPSSLAAWENPAQQALLSQIAPAAQLIPPSSLVTLLGPILQQATISVLKAEADAASAAQSAVEKLTTP